jgi:histidyl-tRNA synthetase
MFRYERPQKGRYRQFSQIGIELLGPSTPLADAEVIACGWQILNDLGIAQDVILNINTLGDSESRDNYRAALVAYFAEHAETLSPDSKTRLEKNPLRILDSKDEGDRKLVANAPLIHAHLSEPAAAFYDGLKAALTSFGVPFIENPRIVRGLDYYNHTAFEFVTTALGAQGTVLAGGRYDGLVEQMGGRPVPGIGWAAGIDRLAMLLAAPPAATPPVIIIGDTAIAVANYLRAQQIKSEIAFQPGLKNGLKYANRLGAKWAVLANENETILKNLDDGAQTSTTVEALSSLLTK